VLASGSTNAGSSVQAGRQPLLLSLHLSGNPLGDAGLHAINRAVRVMSSIQVLTLADIGLDCSLQPVQLQVQVLAHSLLAGPNELITLDFTDNHISERPLLCWKRLPSGCTC
jgi:Ran GTPase-activating protein (RanGAP) involved in mRNA processing and transport